MIKHGVELEYTDYEGYLISEDGRIYSEKSGRFLSNHIDEAHRSTKCTLTCDGKGKVVYIPALVYKAFYGDVPEGYLLTHINGDWKDNRKENITAIKGCASKGLGKYFCPELNEYFNNKNQFRLKTGVSYYWIEKMLRKEVENKNGYSIIEIRGE